MCCSVICFANEETRSIQAKACNERRLSGFKGRTSSQDAMFKLLQCSPLVRFSRRRTWVGLETGEWIKLETGFLVHGEDSGREMGRGFREVPLLLPSGEKKLSSFHPKGAESHSVDGITPHWVSGILETFNTCRQNLSKTCTSLST